MAPFNGIPSERQQITLALAPKFAASLSLLGSSYIIWDILLHKKKRQRRSSRHNNNISSSSSSITTYHRLLIGLSVCDLLMSAGLFTTTWPMPVDTTKHVFGAIGTVQTCEAVGFIEQAGVAAVIYNASLSCYYLVRIRYGMAPHVIQSRLEPWMHAVPIVFGLTTMIASLQLDLYNSGLFDCWIAPFPQGCQESWRSADGSTDCERGNNASLYQWVFDVIPKWSCVLLVTINMWLVHRAVYRQEQSTLKRTLRCAVAAAANPTLNNNNNFSQKPTPRVARRLARQSYLYVGALYLTYIPVIITRSTELISGVVYYGMLLTISIFIPLQGFWNGTFVDCSYILRGMSPFALLRLTIKFSYYLFPSVIVYLRPRYLERREKQRREQQRRNSSSGQGSSSRFLFLNHGMIRAVSEVVREGGLENEEREAEEEEEPTSETRITEMGQSTRFAHDTNADEVVDSFGRPDIDDNKTTYNEHESNTQTLAESVMGSEVANNLEETSSR